jgi:hypothetical protein
VAGAALAGVVIDTFTAAPDTSGSDCRSPPSEQGAVCRRRDSESDLGDIVARRARRRLGAATKR